VKLSHRIILTLVVLVVFSCPVQASNRLKPEDQVRLALVKHLAEEPNRLNAEYLRYIFGMPTVHDIQTMTLDREFDWREARNNQTLCQLNQSMNGKTGEFTSKFSFALPQDTKIDFAAIQSLFNVKPKKRFTQQGLPSETFEIGSNTQVVAARSHNSLTVNTVEIEYRGAPLPAPSVQDINDAKKSVRDAALADRKELNQTETVPLLIAYLHEYPNDVEVRIRLAEVYKANGSLSQAIGQYRLALSQVGTNQELKARCLDGLQQMKIIDGGVAPVQLTPAKSNPALLKPEKKDPLDVGF
jgi:hypothetical protein